MKVDFWQLSRDPAEVVVRLIAQRALAEGRRLLVVGSDTDQLETLRAALWEAKPPAFLACGLASEPGAADQPILLSETLDAANGAAYLVIADGRWRGDEALDFERCFLLFGDATLAETRDHWRAVKARSDLEARFFKQVEGKWVQAG